MSDLTTVQEIISFTPTAPQHAHSSSTSSSADDPPPPLRVLCYGDSLTSGYWDDGLRQSPYSRRLSERLRAAFPDRDIRVTTSGNPGCLVTPRSFTKNLEDQYKRQPDGFDWALILGGTKCVLFFFFSPLFWCFPFVVLLVRRLLSAADKRLWPE